MDIKRRLQRFLDLYGDVQINFMDDDWARNLGRDALAEIERLELIVQRCHVGSERVLAQGNAGDFAEALRAIVEITKGSDS